MKIKNLNKKIIPKKNFLLVERLEDNNLDRSKFIRMDRNERVDEFSKLIYSNIFKNTIKSKIEIYPNELNLRKIIAKKFSTLQQNILLTPGSDAAIKYIFQTYINKKDKVAFLSPTYAMIDYYAKLSECKIINICFDENIKINRLEEKKFFNKKLKAIFIANPNQPTGTILEKKFLFRLLKFCKKKNILLIIDEAYIDFSKTQSLIKFIKNYKNLIITRTFSKAYGLAGVRLGFLASNFENILQLNKSRSLSDINVFAIKAAEYFLKNEYIVKKNIFNIKQSKKLLKIFCRNYHLNLIGSETNFVHINFDNEEVCKKIYNYLYQNKILVRINNNQGLPAAIKNSIRISVGSINYTKTLIRLLKSYFDEKK
jgi:histidinol-phosphate aminotransferase